MATQADNMHQTRIYLQENGLFSGPWVKTASGVPTRLGLDVFTAEEYASSAYFDEKFPDTEWVAVISLDEHREHYDFALGSEPRSETTSEILRVLPLRNQTDYEKMFKLWGEDVHRFWLNQAHCMHKPIYSDDGVYGLSADKTFPNLKDIDI